MVAPTTEDSPLVRLRAIESTTIGAVVRCYAVCREHVSDESQLMPRYPHTFEIQPRKARERCEAGARRTTRKMARRAADECVDSRERVQG